MFVIKLALIKLVILISKLIGKGSSFPGMLATKIKFDFNKINISDSNIIYVIGTNGKTTTTNFIYQMLVNNNISVITNHEGANLITGIKTLLLKHVKFNHQLNAQVLLLEVDEKTIKHTIDFLPPDQVVITNFFRDQLDRYGEIDMIVDEVKTQLKKVDPQLYLNGNDPYIYYQFAQDFSKKIFYGVESELSLIQQHHREAGKYNKVRDIIYCPNCKQPLQYKYYHYGHLGLFNCPSCSISPHLDYVLYQTKDGFSLENQSYKIANLPLYFLFNIISSVSLIKSFGLSIAGLEQLIKDFKFPPGRNQQMIYNNTPVYINLVKNVVGFEETIDYVVDHFNDYKLVVCLNDNYADGKDISWIYDVYVDDLLNKATSIYTSGLRAYDMALRFELAGREDIIVIEDIAKCLQTVLDDNQQVVIISNYTALPKVLNVVNKGETCK